VNSIPPPNPQQVHRYRVLGWVFAYVLLFAYLQSFSRYGFNIWDEGGFANGSLRTLRGETALKDFNPIGYLPGRYWFGALFFKLFGIEIQSLRIGVGLLTPAMVLMAYAISRRIMPAGFAALAAVLTLAAPAMYYNRFFPIFCVANLFFLVRALEHPARGRIVAFAVSIGVSFFFKSEVAVFSAVIGLPLLRLASTRTHPQTLPLSTSLSLSPLRATAIVALAVALFGGVLWAILQLDVAGKLLRIVVDTHRVWGNPFPPLFPFFEQLNAWGPHEMFERLMFYIPLLVYGITALLLARRFWRHEAKPTTPDVILQALLLFGVAAYGLVIWRAGFDNLLRTLQPFYILACYLLARLHARLLPRVSGVGKRYAVNVALLLLPALFLIEMSTHQGFYAGSIGAVLQENEPLRLERLNVYTKATDAGWMKRVLRRIEEYTQPGEPIFAVPLNPIFYFLSDRPNSTAYDWILPGMLNAQQEAQVVEQLRAKPPKMVIYVDIAIDGVEERRFHLYAPAVYEYLEEHYEFVEMIGVFQLLVPRKD
jgi:hypothetical protein